MLISRSVYRNLSALQSVWFLRVVLRKMATECDLSKPKPIVGVCQFTARANKEDNFKICSALVKRAKAMGAQMVFLPEACDYISESRDQAITMAEPLDGDIVSRYKQLAQDTAVWLSLGGLHQMGPESDKRVKNTHIIISCDGDIKATYVKCHLFDLDIKGTVRLCESDYTIHGGNIVPPVSTPIGKLGLATCYDLRFPEMSTALTQQGAQILTYPSAFTQTTGMAHWEIVDPWGRVISQCGEGSDVCVAEVDLTYLTTVREQMPITDHRRHDLYGHIHVTSKCDIDDVPEYQFGHVKLKSCQVFYRSTLSYAFVNIKPVVPGHVLVASLRPAARFKDLDAAEVADLFTTVQKVTRMVEEHHLATSATVAIQDGAEAGQTVQHVHVHILPRKKGDFAKNDEIYNELAKHDEDLTDFKTLRTDEDMTSEAQSLRHYFT